MDSITPMQTHQRAVKGLQYHAKVVREAHAYREALLTPRHIHLCKYVSKFLPKKSHRSELEYIVPFQTDGI